MDKPLNPLTVFLVLLLFGGLLSAKFWVAHRALEVDRPGHMQIHPDGRLFVQVGERLFALSPGGGVMLFDLDELGVGRMLGDFAFFAGGDLLLRRGYHDPGFLRNLWRFFRFDNPTPERVENGEGGLFRCDLSTGECTLFGDGRHGLSDAFHLHIDRATDRVFLADTSRHQLILYGPDGGELDRYSEGLKFPNQIRFWDGRLYVANTNRYELAVIAVDESGFGEALPPIPVTAPRDGAQRRWPVAFTRADGGWWVLMAQSDLAHGGIYRFDLQGERTFTLPQSAGADPIFLEQFDNKLAVADFSARRIDWYESNGSPISAPEYPLLQQYLRELDAQSAGYRDLDLFFTLLFAVALVLGFVTAWVQTRRDRKAPLLPDSGVDPDNPQIHWIEPDAKVIRQYRWALALSLGLMLAMLILMPFACGMRLQLLMMLTTAGVLALLFYLVHRWVARARIGVLGEVLVLKDWRDRTASATAERMAYSDQYLLIGDLMILLATQNQSLFPKQELVQWVYPLMKQGAYLPRKQVQKQLLRNYPELLLALVAILVLLTLVVLFLPGAFR